MYGQLIDTEIPYGLEVAPDEGPDWRVRWAQGAVDLDAPPDGPVVVHRPIWPVYAERGSFVLWIEQFARFDLDPVQRLISVALADPQPEPAALYLRGVIMSLALELSGVSVLHANSVLVGDSVVAFIGQRGAGKTTVTTALTGAGLPLLADDVVPIERNGDGWSARSGYTDLRLRPAAAAMVDLFPPDVLTSLSIDGRTVLHLPPAPVAVARLGGIVVPSPSADHAGSDRIVTLRGRDALVPLLGGFRVDNFLEPRLAARRLEAVTGLLGSVPIGRLEMPVRDRWSADDALALRAVVEQWQESSR